jgi:hypothetical protein
MKSEKLAWTRLADGRALTFTSVVLENFNFRVWHLYHILLDSQRFILFDYESFRIAG